MHGSWKGIFFVVPYQSIPSPLLFIIFMNGLLFQMNETDFRSYADDNTTFVTCDSIENLIKSPENDSMKLFQCFAENQIKANKDKCHLLISTNESNTSK